MDAWCSPERIRQAHLPDEVSNFTPSRPGLSTFPIQAESPLMQGMTVSGLTIMSAKRKPDHRCSSFMVKVKAGDVLVELE